MSISTRFIERPIATTLLTVGIVLAGIVAVGFLPVSTLPQIDFPTISVSASLPGASPETMASSVATPLERQLAHIAGVTEMTSSSSLGKTSITVQFDLDRNIDGAARDVQAAINAAQDYLPADLPIHPSYRKVNPSEAPILILSMQSNTMTKADIYDVADSIVAQKLSQVDGIGQVIIGGGASRAVRVELNPMALNKYGIGLDTVRSAIQNTNADRPKGQLADGSKTWEIQTNDQLYTAQDYRPLIVTRDASGAVVRLSDVGQVLDSVADIRQLGLVNGKPSIPVIIFRQPGANVIKAVDAVRAELPVLQAAISPAINLSVVLDRSPTIRASVNEARKTIIIAGLLVVFVVFLFLRNLRTTIIPGIVVPVSIVSTFGAMYLLHFSIDNLSLMALTIATGFVVDDAIVVVENITRYIEKGMSPKEAALKGAGQVGFTILTISISLVAVFIPILLMGGVLGRLFREFALTLSVAILISMVVSLTTTPMMCAILLKPHKDQKHGRFYNASEGVFNSMHGFYKKTLGWALDHQGIMLIVMIIVLVTNIFLFILVPKGFFPQQDTGRLSGNIQASQDISFQAMEKKLRAVVNIVMKDPAVDTVTAFTGGTNSARMFIALKDLQVRKVSSEQVIARLRKQLSSVPGAPAYLTSVQDLTVGARMSNAQYQYTVQSDNYKDLITWEPKIQAALAKLPQLADLNSDKQSNGLQTNLVIDRVTASRLGVTPEEIDSTLYDAFGQRQVSTTYKELNQYHAVMEVAPQFWQRASTLRDIYVASSSGTLVPLSAFAHYGTSTTSLAVAHQGEYPAITFSFNLPLGLSLGDAVNAVNSAMKSIFLPVSIHGNFQGTAQAFQSSLSNEPLLIVTALLAVYIVLGILYESYIHPVTILSTLPSAGVGAMLALFFTGTDLSIIAMIGVILLIGIVKKNGIMMVDFALASEREEGKNSHDSINEACLSRFRPIMMTTMSAILGAVPLAFGTGMGSELRRPLGITIIGGLIFSQMLTLYTTPVIYLYMERFKIWFEGVREKSSTKGRPMFSLKRIFLSICCLLVVGCSIGPKYVRPTASIPAAYKENADWKIAKPQDAIVRGAWWKIFNDPQLDMLEDQVNISNQNIAIAQAQYAQAYALVQAAKSSFFPILTTSGSYTREHTGSDSGKSATSQTLLSANVDWELDLWGKIRKTIAANRANAEASAADLEGVRLSAQAQLAEDYFQLCSLDVQKKLLDDTQVIYQKFLTLTKNRYVSGVAAESDVIQAQTQLEGTEAQEIDIGVERSQLEHAIALLIGRPASDFSLPSLTQSSTVPVVPTGLPSEILEQRPDIAAAERTVAAANALIGVAQAAYFPTLTLSASGSYGSSDLSRLFSSPNPLWSVGPALAETIFDAGLRQAQTAQAKAVYDQDVASYRQTVLTAFGQVEDNLAALRILEQEAQVQDEAVADAKKAVILETNQYQAGTVSALDVINTQATALTNEKTAVTILGERMNACVLLIQYLGGGWTAPKQ